MRNRCQDRLTLRQPLALLLISMEQSLTFADMYRLKRKLLSGPILWGACESFHLQFQIVKNALLVLGVIF